MHKHPIVHLIGILPGTFKKKHSTLLVIGQEKEITFSFESICI